MALVAVAADKGAPGVTTASLALAAVWPRPVLLAECDAAGGDLFYRLPGADGGRLDPQRGLLSLAVAARRGIQPHQVWRHTQKLHGGLDILTGLVNAEQAAGLQALWGQVGKVLAEVPDVDVIADCGRLGADGPFYDMLAHASAVVLIARVTLEDVVRLRDRVIALAQGIANRRLTGVPIGVVIVADRKHFRRHIADAGQALAHSGAPARILGGLADDPRTAQMLRGRWSTKLDRSLLIRTARELAGQIARDLPVHTGAVARQGQYPPGWWPGEQRSAAPGPGAAPQLTPVPAEPPPTARVPPGQVPPQRAGGQPVPARGLPATQVRAKNKPTEPNAVKKAPAAKVPLAPVAATTAAVAPAPDARAGAQTEPTGVPVLGVPVLGVPAVTGSAEPRAQAPPPKQLPLPIPAPPEQGTQTEVARVAHGPGQRQRAPSVPVRLIAALRGGAAGSAAPHHSRNGQHADPGAGG